MLQEIDCPGCGRSELFEAVTCPDGHDEECPERACTACGTVVEVGPVPLPAQLRVLRGAA